MYAAHPHYPGYYVPEALQYAFSSGRVEIAFMCQDSAER